MNPCKLCRNRSPVTASLTSASYAFSVGKSWKKSCELGFTLILSKNSILISMDLSDIISKNQNGGLPMDHVERRDRELAYISDSAVMEEQKICRQILQKLNFMDRSDFEGIGQVPINIEN